MATSHRIRTYTSRPAQWKLLKPVARDNRKQPTKAEQRLWNALRRGKLGTRFRRQHVIGRFVVDFLNFDTKLIVKVDGPVHDPRQKEDSARERHLSELGYRVVRFTNDQVIDDLDHAVGAIRAQLLMPPEQDTPSPSGRGGRGVR